MTLATAFEKVDSLSELKERLRQSPENILLGADAESPQMFFHFASVRSNNAAIGIVSGDAGTTPQVIEHLDCYFFGFNQHVVKVAKEPLGIQGSLYLDGLFFEFIQLPEKSRTLAIHELGVVCIDARLNVLWSIHTDVLVSWEIADHALLLEEQDSGLVRRVNLDDMKC
jgi:hypothetical protein